VSVRLTGSVAKLDAAKRLVYGWASVATDRGEALVDRQGDLIDMDSLEDAVVKFMEDKRATKAMHEGDQTGVVVESFVASKEKWRAMGIQCDREGWWIGVKVRDPETWEAIRSGRLPMFSVGGRGYREDA
jgi:hypothetical protein